jgi:hypothetical protein
MGKTGVSPEKTEEKWRFEQDLHLDFMGNLGFMTTNFS